MVIAKPIAVEEVKKAKEKYEQKIYDQMMYLEAMAENPILVFESSFEEIFQKPNHELYEATSGAKKEIKSYDYQSMMMQYCREGLKEWLREHYPQLTHELFVGMIVYNFPQDFKICYKGSERNFIEFNIYQRNYQDKRVYKSREEIEGKINEHIKSLEMNINRMQGKLEMVQEDEKCEETKKKKKRNLFGRKRKDDSEEERLIKVKRQKVFFEKEIKKMEKEINELKKEKEKEIQKQEESEFAVHALIEFFQTVGYTEKQV